MTPEFIPKPKFVKSDVLADTSKKLITEIAKVSYSN